MAWISLPVMPAFVRLSINRPKEHLKKLMERDPIVLLRTALEEKGWMNEEEFEALDKEQRERMVDAMKFAEESPWPNPATLEQDVLAGDAS
jgi:pyruvate dehydrogenase E1 component alpha subunit